MLEEILVRVQDGVAVEAFGGTLDDILDADVLDAGVLEGVLV